MLLDTENINTLKEDIGHDSECQEEKKEGFVTLFLKNLLSRIYPIGVYCLYKTGLPLKLQLHSMLKANNPRIAQIFARLHVQSLF